MTLFHRSIRTAGLSLAALAFFSFATRAAAISSAVNISTRMVVETGDNVLIGGFIVTGSGQKKILVRAIGPSLAQSGVAGALSDPILELHDASGALLLTNDNWRTSQQDAIIATGAAPGNDRDSALIATVNPGNYTAVVRGVNNATGVALVEVYDLDGATSTTRLGNISTRGHVLSGDNVMIGGFIVRGDISKRMIVRVKGPSLSLNGTLLAGRLLDPMLELHDGNGALIAQNDNWRTSQQAEIQASTVAPTDDKEPALVATLPPGNYTAVVRGTSNSTGIGLIEFYDLDQPPSTDGSTLYISQLRAQAGTASQGSGTATLRLSADEKSAIVSFNYSGLSSPISGLHIHLAPAAGQSGPIVFDLDETAPQPNGTYIWVLAPSGTSSVADIIAAIKSGLAYINIHTSLNPNGEINGFFNISKGAQVAPVPTPPPPLASGTPTLADAGRFLSQSTFGVKTADLSKVQSQGFDAFLNEQFSAPMSSHLAFVDAEAAAFPSPSPGATPQQLNITQTNDAWWTYAANAPDQLRQRIAFALSEFFVVSNTTGNLGNRQYALPAYYDVLVKNAFGNYRQLLEEITLNPAMGAYLNMLQNDKANPATGRHPNENYAREIMQLFSIGLYELNLDGSLTLDSSGFPIATYNQDAILGTAAVFTGWTYGQPGATTPVFNPPQNWRVPMINIATRHETAAKQILNGVLLPSGQSAAQDLKATLDTIFNHPNVSPFFCKQMIQRLVTSNPSPGYVYRVASVFNDNGQGVRGDLKAVFRAILLDYDARGSATTAQGVGKEREPVLSVTQLLRAFDATSTDAVVSAGNFSGPKFSVRNAFANLGEEAMHSPTVFNFFSPEYESPGAIASAGLLSPEFEITTETTVITIANYLRTAIYSYLGPSTGRISLNFTYQQNIAGDSAALVDHLNSLLMHGAMSFEMRNTLINAVNQIASSNPLERVRTAVYLVVNSPEFAVEK